MRIPTLLLLLCFVLPGGARAEEKPIPIEVNRGPGVEVTDAQLDWIRVWLRKNLHENDLPGIEVDIRNRMHPGIDYRAEARLSTRVSGTWVVQRVIRLMHEDWPAWGKEQIEFTNGWHVRDFDRVTRAFDLDGMAKVMQLDDSLSYSMVHKVLQVVRKNAFDFGEFVIKEEDRPTVKRIIWIRSERVGRIRIYCGGVGRGTWCEGRLKDGRFIVESRGMYIS